MLQIVATDLSKSPERQMKNDLNYGFNLKPLVSQPPLLSCQICVIIPVKDEAQNIESTLLALTNQVNLKGKPLDKNLYEIIVLANNCSDNSAEIIRKFAKKQPQLVLHLVEMTIESDRAHIGWVRKLLMDEAYRRLKSLGKNRGTIASTDGDTRVASDWIAATLAEIHQGADAVGGRIITSSQERQLLDSVTRLYYLRRLRYGYLSSQLEACLDPDFTLPPQHHFHYGASFALTTQMYGKVGGLPPLPSSEDVALYNALLRVDARFCHSQNVRVVTSARDLGRAKAGLADRLAELKIMGQKQQAILVESPTLLESRFRLRRHLRYFWQKQQNGLTHSYFGQILARFLGIETNLLLELIKESSTYGLLIEQIGLCQQDNRQLTCENQQVTIQKAIRDLSKMIKQFSQSNSYFLRQQEIEYLRNLNSLEQIQPILLLPQLS